ncbi:MAG: LLM class flavin-dependent oxidoreductase [bacterium]|nr:LLM class flavin-dependent oxidoreductase [bacterium]
MRNGLILVTGSARGDVELAIRAEEKGFDSVFSTESFNRHGYVPLTAIAQATSRIRIGTGIANACTPDQAQDRLAQWKDLTEDPLLDPPSIGVRPERVIENAHTILDLFGCHS